MKKYVVLAGNKVPFGVIYRGVVPFLAGLVLCAAFLFLFLSWRPSCPTCS